MNINTIYYVQYLGSINTFISEGEKDPQNVDPKRRKIAVSETEECVNDIQHKIPDENNGRFLWIIHFKILSVFILVLMFMYL